MPEERRFWPDWGKLAADLGTITADGKRGGDEYGRRALTEILGVDTLRDAVDYYVNGEAGSELVRSVLHILRASPAAERCLEIYESEKDQNKRATAVELLRVTASEHHLPWVLRFFEDSDPAIQNWGAGVLESISELGTVSMEELEPYIAAGEKHSNPDVRRLTQYLRKPT